MSKSSPVSGTACVHGGPACLECLEDRVVGAVRVWMDEPNLIMSHERHGIVILTVALRREAALVGVSKLAEMIPAYQDALEDVEGIDTLNQFLDMMHRALSGEGNQLMPLTGDESSPFDSIFGKAS